MHLMNSILIFLVTIPMVASQAPATYCPMTGQDVVRLRASSMDQLKKLKQLIQDHPNLHIKPWVQPTGSNTPALYMMPSDVAEYLVPQAKSWGMDAAVIMQNVQRSLLDLPDPAAHTQPYQYAYADPTRNRTTFSRGYGPESFKLGEFHPLDEVNAFMESLKARFSKVCDMESIGRSYGGKEMYMLKIGTNPNPTRGIFIDAAMHAREWVATSTAMYIAAQLCMNYYRNPEIKALVDDITWYILPVVNVDGYEYTWQRNRNWRRSRSKPDPCNGEECRCRGVDLNRNWDSHWNTSDSCAHPCCNTFAGTRPNSEPEVVNLSKKLKSLENKVQAYVSFHSFGQLWMYPYGHQRGVYTKDVADLYEVAELAVQAVKKVHGTEYKYGSVGDQLYEYSGGSQDWVRDHTRIKYSYLVELRPQGFDGERAGTFCIDPALHALQAGQEMFEGIKVVAKAVKGELKLTGKPWKKKKRGEQEENGGEDASTSVRGKCMDMKVFALGLIVFLIMQIWA